MLPFFFIPNKNRLFLLYTMLQAIYQEPIYTFYVTTEDRRINRSVPVANLWFLFKFTNNMSGAVKWSYGQNAVVYDRYTKVEFTQVDIPTQQPEDPFLGLIDLWENGYWNYEVYECSSETVITVLNSYNAPLDPTIPSSAGSWVAKDPSGDVLESKDFDTTLVYYNEEVVKLISDDIPVNVNSVELLDETGTVYDSQNIWIKIEPFRSEGQFVRWTNIVQTTTGTDYYYESNCPVGSSFGFKYESTGADFMYHNLTTYPETGMFSVPQNPNYTTSASLVVEMSIYGSPNGAAGGGADLGIPQMIKPVTNPISVAVAETYPLGLNNQMHDVATVNNGWFMFPSQFFAFLTINGKVEQGKLYVSETAGEEQVQYLERGGQVTTLTITNGGTGYTIKPTLTIVGANTGQATATCTVVAGVITTVTITNSGNGYTTDPIVTLSASAGSGGVILASILQNNYIYTS